MEDEEEEDDDNNNNQTITIEESNNIVNSNHIDNIYDRFRKEVNVNHVPLRKEMNNNINTSSKSKSESNEVRINQLNQKYNEKLKSM